MGLIKYLLIATLLITAQCQLSDRSEIEDGGSFNLTCDVSRIGTVPVAVTSLYSLSIERTGVSGIQTIAVYSPGLTNNITKTPPDNRPWVIEASGGKGPVNPDNNRASIKLTLYVPDAKCSDAGLYSCNASFPPAGGVSTASRSLNMTSKAKTEVPVITSDHHNGNGNYYSSNPEGQNLTLTCSVLGPKSLVLKWQYATGGFNLVDYLYTNDIKVFNPLLVPGTTCGQYRLESALTLTVQSQETMYVCAVLDGNNKVTETNFTIGILTDPTQGPSSGASEEPSGANVGAIVGGVIGGLVLIAIIVIVVYFCWYRKRNDDDSERDKEVGAVDTTHAPPPVFYAEPKKVKKDERDGVRPDKGFTNEALDNSYDDSKDHRGPPQYINTVDGEDLPRYEKETHRGRSNKGYDDENEKNEGHGRRHRRDRKDKEDREDRKPPRKDYDDHDKGRHYSTDDGTDNREPQTGYGDPNMGTSI